MSQILEPIKTDKEFGRNWVTTSRFMFYVHLLALLAFVGGCSCNMYRATRFESKPKVQVQESSQYTPVYK